MTERTTPVHAMAVAGALLAIWDALHPLSDQWFQTSRDAANKGACGPHLVYRDGTLVDEEAEDDNRAGETTMTATRLGWISAGRHVAHYTSVQLLGTVLLTRALGYRVPVAPLLAGTAINSVTHLVIDKRQPCCGSPPEQGGEGT